MIVFIALYYLRLKEEILNRFILLFLGTTLLFSCVSTANKDNFVLKEGEGAMVAYISSDSMKNFSLRLSNGSALAPSLKVKKDDLVKVVILKEGEYKFNYISIGGFFDVNRSAVLNNQPSFKIESGKVNYIGDLKCEMVGYAYVTTDYSDNENKTMVDAISQIPQLADYDFVNNLKK